MSHWLRDPPFICDIYVYSSMVWSVSFFKAEPVLLSSDLALFYLSISIFLIIYWISIILWDYIVVWTEVVCKDIKWLFLDSWCFLFDNALIDALTLQISFLCESLFESQWMLSGRSVSSSMWDTSIKLMAGLSFFAYFYISSKQIEPALGLLCKLRLLPCIF